MPRAVIITAIQVEYMAVQAYLTELKEQVHPRGDNLRTRKILCQ